MPTNPPDFDAQAQTLAGNLFRHISARGTHGILDFSAFAAIAAALAAAYQQGREEQQERVDALKKAVSDAFEHGVVEHGCRCAYSELQEPSNG